MPPTLQEVAAQAHLLSPADKVVLAEELLAEIDASDPRLTTIWDEEIRARIKADRDNGLPFITHKKLVAKYISS